MAKRFTDTDKWKKPFIRGLQGAYKLLWLYILDDCDHAGIWQVDFEVARIRTGEQIDKQAAINAFGDRIEIFAEGSKWFLRDFIEFQYGQLNEKNRMHLSVINILTKNEIGAYKALPRGQGQEQGKGQGTKQGKGKNEIFEEIFTDDIFINQLESAHNGKDLKQAWEECYVHHSNSKSPPREIWEWKQKLNTWLTIKQNGKSNGIGKKQQHNIDLAKATLNEYSDVFGKQPNVGTGK